MPTIAWFIDVYFGAVNLENIMEKSKIGEMVRLSKRSGKLAPASMSLSGPAGKRIVVSAAKRVLKTHDEVIKALAKR